MPRDSLTVSNNMRKIHSKDTSIELQLRKALWHKGYHYRKNYKALPGSPDIVLTKYKIAIFCDSEFFHGKDWEILKLRLEKGKNPDFWIKKIERNRNRDFENDRKLLFLGYTVLHFWGQDITKHTDECLQAIEEAISCRSVFFQKLFPQHSIFPIYRFFLVDHKIRQIIISMQCIT